MFLVCASPWKIWFSCHLLLVPALEAIQLGNAGIVNFVNLWQIKSEGRTQFSPVLYDKIFPIIQADSRRSPHSLEGVRFPLFQNRIMPGQLDTVRWKNLDVHSTPTSQMYTLTTLTSRCRSAIHMTKHPIPYMAFSTRFLTKYQSALRSANSYTSSARKMP